MRLIKGGAPGFRAGCQVVSLLAVVAVLVTTSPLAAGSQPAVDVGCPWLAPVDAPVIDAFRPPDHRYGSGNRGLEYGVAGGERVRVVASGQVGFVGPVGGRRFVVVEHDTGLKSTYGPVQAIVVVRGQRVERGDELAAATIGLHLTARLGETYLDPQAFIDGRCGRARLIPIDRPAASRFGATPSSLTGRSAAKVSGGAPARPFPARVR